MLLKKLKKYLVGTDSETFAVSLVTDPAIEENFLYFKKEDGEKLEVALESNEKHMVYGAVLVPNRPIYRIDDSGEEFYVEFTKESIEKMSQDYLKSFRQFNATVQHEEEAPEVCMVETWLKSDMEYDKSVALGLNKELPVGTWFAGFKVNNVDVWERIKDGELRGFSVESMIELEEIDFSKVEKVELEEEPTVESQPTEEVVIEQPAEVTQPEVEEPAVEEPSVVEEPKPNEAVEQPAVVEEPKVNPLEELVKTLQSELNELKTTNQQLVEKINDLGKQPSVKPLSTVGGGGQGSSYDAWREQMSQYLR